MAQNIRLADSRSTICDIFCHAPHNVATSWDSVAVRVVSPSKMFITMAV